MHQSEYARMVGVGWTAAGGEDIAPEWLHSKGGCRGEAGGEVGKCTTPASETPGERDRGPRKPGAALTGILFSADPVERTQWCRSAPERPTRGVRAQAFPRLCSEPVSYRSLNSWTGKNPNWSGRYALKKKKKKLLHTITIS